MGKKVVGIGEVVWDMLPDGPVLGGAPLNFAFVAYELGCRSAVISAVGRDELSEDALSRIREIGIDTSLIQRNDLPTSRVIITLDSDGIPHYEILENVAWDDIACPDVAMKAVAGADAVCWGSLAQRSLRSRGAILSMLDSARRDCLKVFDVNLRQHYYDREILGNSLKRSDILKLNEDELPALADIFGFGADKTSAIAGIIREFSLSWLIYTAGASFSEIYGGDGDILSHIDTPKVNVADTVGAGDAFTAGFVSALLNGKSVADAHKQAVRVSAYMCTRKGAINPIDKHFKLND